MISIIAFYVLFLAAVVFVLTRLVYCLSPAWPLSLGKVLVVNGTVLALMIATSAIESTGLYTPSTVPYCVVNQVIVVVWDLVRLRRASRNPTMG